MEYPVGVDEGARIRAFWSRVVVLVPERTEDAAEEVGRLLAPYDANLPLELHREPCGCVGAEALE